MKCYLFLALLLSSNLYSTAFAWDDRTSWSAASPSLISNNQIIFSFPTNNFQAGSLVISDATITFNLNNLSTDDSATARIGCTSVQNAQPVWFTSWWNFLPGTAPYRRPYHFDLPDDCILSQGGQSTLIMESTGGFNGTPSAPILHYRLTNDLNRTRENDQPIEGYSDKISYRPGDTIGLHVHAPQGTYSVEWIRWGKEPVTLLQQGPLSGTRQALTPLAYRDGASWPTTHRFPIPENWKSGMYSAKIRDANGSFHITFILRERPRSLFHRPSTLGVIASTNTWQAYNPWGGASFYHYLIQDGSERFGDGTGPGVHLLSFLRPNPEANPTSDVGHLASGEKHILAWLEQNHYQYGMLTDADLDQEIPDYSTLIISTHSEYWTRSMIEHLKAFQKRGGNLLYLSGNGIFWKVTLNQNQIEAHKDGSLHRMDGNEGGKWRFLDYPSTLITGLLYDDGSPYGSCSPYEVLEPNHWIFKDTHVAKGSEIGSEGLNRRGCNGGASGWEMDWKDPNLSPAGLVHLAKGKNPGPGGGADMVYFENPDHGGAVFAVGSITFGGSLRVDPMLSQMVRNVLEHFHEFPVREHRLSNHSLERRN